MFTIREYIMQYYPCILMKKGRKGDVMKRKAISTFVTAVIMATVIVCSGGCSSKTDNGGIPEAKATTAKAEEASTEQLSYEEVYANIEAYVNDKLQDTETKTIKQDEDGNIMLYVAFSDSTEVAKAAKEGDSDSAEQWKNMSDTFTTIGASAYDYLNKNGYGDKYFGAALINEKDTDKYLLVSKNDTVVYDIVNGIGTEEGDEDSLDDTFKEGDTFKVGNLEITMTKKKLGYEVDDPYGLHDLPDGYEYLKCDWTYKNTGESDAYCSVYDFKCYADDKECEQDYFSMDYINSNLGGGRSVEFETFYKVPKDAETIELEYTTLLGQGKKAIVKVK